MHRKRIRALRQGKKSDQEQNLYVGFLNFVLSAINFESQYCSNPTKEILIFFIHKTNLAIYHKREEVHLCSNVEAAGLYAICDSGTTDKNLKS